jgi:hypothetical protein
MKYFVVFSLICLNLKQVCADNMNSQVREKNHYARLPTCVFTSFFYYNSTLQAEINQLSTDTSAFVNPSFSQINPSNIPGGPELPMSQMGFGQYLHPTYSSDGMEMYDSPNARYNGRRFYQPHLGPSILGPPIVGSPIIGSPIVGPPIYNPYNNYNYDPYHPYTIY